MVICLERGADVHMAQLMPLPLTVSCFSKVQIGFTFPVPAHPGSPGKKAIKQVYVCMFIHPAHHSVQAVTVNCCRGTAQGRGDDVDASSHQWSEARRSPQHPARGARHSDVDGRLWAGDAERQQNCLGHRPREVREMDGRVRLRDLISVTSSHRPGCEWLMTCRHLGWSYIQFSLFP